MNDPKVILVTGASSGIGRACAQLLHRRSHIVYGTSRNPGSISVPWRMVELDVTRDDSVETAVAKIIAEQGRIDVVINNAGLVMAGAIEDTRLDEAQRQFDTNFFGVLRVCKAVLPSMREKRVGLIINIGSLAGLLGLPFQGLYSASKFAIEGFTEALRLEVAEFGIDAVVIEPGDIATSVVENRVRIAASASGSAYRQAFEKVVATYEKEERAGASPDVVASKVLAVIETRRRSPRYGAGPISQRLLTGLKPFVTGRLFERGLMIYYGLKPRA
jgi:NAD(P)-dependent dehydrogenase (short-subunit alcohol dehydrogenase family)